MLGKALRADQEGRDLIKDMATELNQRILERGQILQRLQTNKCLTDK